MREPGSEGTGNREKSGSGEPGTEGTGSKRTGGFGGDRFALERNPAVETGRSYYGRMTIPRIVYKGHGTANDFVLYADPEGTLRPEESEIQFLCDRHRGLGADGLLRLVPTRLHDTIPQLDADEAERMIADGAEWFMDYYNADGSVAEMCGNGSRVITLFAKQLGVWKGEDGEKFALATRAGVKYLDFLGPVDGLGKNVFHVNMGPWKKGDDGHYRVSLVGVPGNVRGTFVDMGNPHVVCIVDDLVGVTRGVDTELPGVEALDLSRPPVVEPPLEHGQNVEFVRIESLAGVDCGRAYMRVNERGVGETMSCGTGLCATGVVLASMTGVSEWYIRIRGGVVRVDVFPDRVELTGDARIVGRFEFLEDDVDDATRAVHFA
ncbi:diaminopimelate epimerase [Pseudoscardovia radai]|uniref:Diaminopimelate epimerase n=2 Tax=Pseudoscardovia radai TaxID=987066 RepID=A0A261F0N2_9BIFI|nr:diaminopimelate epimerase [Pseudoscardovia radai]